MKRARPMVLAFAWLVGCAAGHKQTIVPVLNMEQARSSPAAREAERLAPQAYAIAEQQRDLATKAQAQGDVTGAALYAEHATSAYNHALILGRIARASSELELATQARKRADDEIRTVAGARASLDRDADALDDQLRAAREAARTVGPADPTRETARLVASRSLAIQARLLCGSARLAVATRGADPAMGVGLDQAEAAAAAIELQLDSAPKPAPIEAAVSAHSGCLAALTRARRLSGQASVGRADTLLAELSARGDLSPRRDDRGVLVELRDIFRGTELSSETAEKMKELANVGVAHPTFGIQVVVHDASPPTSAELARDSQRANSIVKALVSGGVPAARIKGEVAGAKSPLVDPDDRRNAPRNARVEIVFVDTGR